MSPTGAGDSGRGRGRRPGSPDTRTTIITAARDRFASDGFTRTTIRAVADQAGVDAALVHHYYGTKADLFLAAMDFPVDPRKVIADEVTGPLAGDLDGFGDRLLRAILRVWDDPQYRVGLLALLRRAIEPDGESMYFESFVQVVLVPAGRAAGLDDVERRMPIVASQVIGLVMMRYVLRVPPLDAMSVDELVGIYGPTIQRYSLEPLD